MHACHSGRPLTDAELDRELGDALAVEPSAEFLARVRMRVAEEQPRPALWRRSWMLAGAAACVAALAVSAGSIEMDPPPLPRLAAGLAALVPPLTPAPLAFAVAASRRSNDRRTEKPAAEMRAVMIANAVRTRSLRTRLEERDYDALLRDAGEYRQNFTYLEEFWGTRNVAGAAGISRAGLIAAAALETAAHARDDAALEAAIAAITGTCVTCHKHHREELPDGSYQISL